MEHKIAVIIFSGSGNHADMGKIANAMQIIREFAEAGDKPKLLFDGAGVTWPLKLALEEHPLHRSFEKVLPYIEGVCKFCANAFKVATEVEKTGVKLLEDYKGHPSVRSLMEEGYQIITL
ncbi:MAG: hypothetical protein ACRDE2_08815 [Chitinophagaceae bacterium]